MLRKELIETLRARLVERIRANLLEPGDRLPSAREVGSEYSVDPRTALAAYHALAEEGLVELRRRSGVFVAQATGNRTGTLPARWFSTVFAEGLARDVSVRRLPALLQEAIETLRMRAAVIECNDDQLFSMSHELREDFGLEAIPVDLTTLSAEGPLPSSLQRADLLVSAGHNDRISDLSWLLGTPSVVTEVRSDLVDRMLRLLTQGEVRFIVSDPRFAQKMGALVSTLPGSASFRCMVLGEHDLSAIPADAFVYATRLALTRLKGERIPGRLIPPVRIFSPACAQSILSIMVTANLRASAAKSRQSTAPGDT
jgi:GntR family transcriptional regulator